MLGISGISSDMRDIEEAAAQGDKNAILGNEMYAYRIKKYIGSYTAALGGVDILIFTGGIGENAPQMRADICTGLEYMGISVDNAKNDGLRGKEAIIGNDKVKVMVVPTNEELVIAQDTMQIVTQL
jgi:acetate kinase